ncbi:serine hydrolase, partial [Ilumatobacter nonamiensis]|uniref:serine hydrolase n=1 Tax=Ilumatobacter nonamiensis TaxID=467093 RepID=UPI0006848923
TTSGDDTAPEESAPAGPPGDPAQTVTREDVDAGLELVPEHIEAMLESSGVPGLAVAVVFDDEVVYAEGFGVREIGGDEAVDADTVFQVASLSKAISATAVAGVVGDGTIAWDDPIVEHLPDFALSDPYVTEHVTYADLFTHRSGLPAHAGDLLEDLGYDQQEVFDRLVQEPLSPFRAQHLYTNFGLTAAAEAAANASGDPWDVLVEERLFTPAGMTDSSALFAEYIAADNRAVPHQRDADGDWIVTTDQRDPDQQSPAGGISSTANDLAQWLRLQLGDGELDDEPIIDPAALLQMHTPHSVSHPPATPSSHTGTYGLGTGVGVRDDGYTNWTHSGAFLLGTGTNFNIVPGQQLGVAVITNGQPVGLAEATSDTVIDLMIDGAPRLDWLSGYMGAFAGLYESELPTDWSEPVAEPAPPSAPGTYVGTYDNAYYGPMTVEDAAGTLVMTLGPDDMTFELTPYDGDTFLFTPPGENSLGPTGIAFDVEGSEATSATSEFYDTTGLGTWNRVD